MTMTSGVSAVILALAWFAAVNLAASLIALALSAVFADRIAVDARRARWLLGVRLFPSVAALIVAVALFAPAHVRMEPAQTDERLGIVLLAFAASGVILIAAGVLRFLIVALRHVRLGMFNDLPRIADGHPPWVEMPLVAGIALAGVIRPRVLIGSIARQALTKAELEVAVAHEIAHQQAHDNLTRAVLACAPDFFGFMPAARRLEQLWEGEAECLADARAVAGSAHRARCLASALVKVARLGALPRQPISSPGWSTFHQPALLETRVRLLVESQPSAVSTGRHARIGLVFVAAAVVVAWAGGVPRDLHAVTEAIIALTS